MQDYSLTHLTDSELLHGLTSLVSCERATTARVLAHIAEVDERRLYLPAAYPSMHAYCVHELRFSRRAAFRRIHAARKAREFPVIFRALAQGRINMTAVIALAPYLGRDTVDDLLAAAVDKTKPEIEQLLAERFPEVGRSGRGAGHWAIHRPARAGHVGR